MIRRMNGVILAGGTGSRLDPLTRVTNKHLLPVFDRPMIYFAVEQLVGAGIRDIVIVTAADQADAFRKVLGDGTSLGARRLEIARQERPGGIAEALGLAAPFAAGGPVAVLLGDNIFERSVAPIVERRSPTLPSTVSRSWRAIGSRASSRSRARRRAFSR